MSTFPSSSTSEQSSEPEAAAIWFKNPAGFLFDKTRALDFIPDRSQSLVEQLNAAMRFAIYFTVLVLIIRRDAKALFFAAFVAALTWIIYAQDRARDAEKREAFDKLGLAEDYYKRACVKPTKHNPFMNVTPVDYADFPNRPKACKVKDAAADTAAFFENGLHRLEDDVYQKSASDRQFFTMPYTTIPNDRGAFADWLYKTGPTCKEKGIVCKGAL